jgi:aspartate kinase
MAGRKRPIEEPVVTAVTFDKNQAKMSVLDVPDQPGVAAKLFGALAAENINVDMIIQSAAREETNDVSFTVSAGDLEKARAVLGALQQKLGSAGILFANDVAKISIVGVGMKSHPGVAAKMFQTLADEGINIEMISTSEIKISCIIKKAQLERAVRTLHAAFGLDRKR